MKVSRQACTYRGSAISSQRAASAHVRHSHWPTAELVPSSGELWLGLALCFTNSVSPFAHDICDRPREKGPFVVRDRFCVIHTYKDAPNRMTQSFFPSRVPFQSYEPIRAATSHTMERRYWNENIDIRFAPYRRDVDLLTFHVSVL